MKPDRVVSRIRDLGYESIADFKRLHGLSGDSRITSAIEWLAWHSFRICTRHCVVPAKCRWPRSGLTYRIAIKEFPDVNINNFAQAVRIAFDRWQAAANIAAFPADRKQQADIVITAEKRDGAWCQFPGESATVALVLNQSDVYAVGESIPITKVDLVAVLTHQIGHALGLGHLPPGNIMSPLYDPRITGPCAGDIREIVARYGVPLKGTNDA